MCLFLEYCILSIEYERGMGEKRTNRRKLRLVCGMKEEENICWCITKKKDNLRFLRLSFQNKSEIKR